MTMTDDLARLQVTQGQLRQAAETFGQVRHFS